jgi:hypothetical protein
MTTNDEGEFTSIKFKEGDKFYVYSDYIADNLEEFDLPYNRAFYTPKGVQDKDIERYPYPPETKTSILPSFFSNKRENQTQSVSVYKLKRNVKLFLLDAENSYNFLLDYKDDRRPPPERKFKDLGIGAIDSIKTKRFALWMCDTLPKFTGLDLGYVLMWNNPQLNQQNYEIIFCNPFRYLERDYEDPLDWQFRNTANIPEETLKLMRLMSTYTNAFVYDISGDILQHSIWSSLYTEKLIEDIKRENEIMQDLNMIGDLEEYFKFAVFISFIHNIGKLGSDKVINKRDKSNEINQAENIIDGITEIQYENQVINLEKIIDEFGFKTTSKDSIKSLIKDFIKSYKDNQTDLEDYFFNKYQADSKIAMVLAPILQKAYLLARQPIQSSTPRVNVVSKYYNFLANFSKKYPGMKYDYNVKKDELIDIIKDIMKPIPPIPTFTQFSPNILLNKPPLLQNKDINSSLYKFSNDFTKGVDIKDFINEIEPNFINTLSKPIRPGAFGIIATGTDSVGKNIVVKLILVDENDVHKANKIIAVKKEAEYSADMGIKGIGPEVYLTFHTNNLPDVLIPSKTISFELHKGFLQVIVMQSFDQDCHDYIRTASNINDVKTIVQGMLNVFLKAINENPEALFCTDIKPGNFVVNRATREVKMIDFGADYCKQETEFIDDIIINLARPLNLHWKIQLLIKKMVGGFSANENIQYSAFIAVLLIFVQIHTFGYRFGKLLIPGFEPIKTYFEYIYGTPSRQVILDSMKDVINCVRPVLIPGSNPPCYTSIYSNLYHYGQGKENKSNILCRTPNPDPAIEPNITDCLEDYINTIIL